MSSSSRKRPLSTSVASAVKTTSKKIRPGALAEVNIIVKTEQPEDVPSSTIHDDGPPESLEALRERFINIFSEKEHLSGISNSVLKARFGASYTQLVPIINQLIASSRLCMSKLATGELCYVLVSQEEASKFAGLDASARMVYQVIEKSGTMGIWTKDIRLQTNIQQQALNKIFKTLEGRQLIKPVKSVTAKAKKLYMVFDLTPSKELTGGVWYSDLEFDHEFISELRNFILHMIRRSTGGMTLKHIRDKIVQHNVSRVELSMKEIEQVVRTLVYDYLIEESMDENDNEDTVYVHSKRLSTFGDFKWWDALVPDFHFRTIRFEDGVTLESHEPHYHTR